MPTSRRAGGSRRGITPDGTGPAAPRARRSSIGRSQRRVTEVDEAMVFGTPKTHQHRSVVVPGFLREKFGMHVAAKAPVDLVLASRTGTPLRVQNFRRDRFDRASEAVGVPGLTPHELRHTAASFAIASGASGESGAIDARPCLRADDPGPLRAPVS